MLNSFWKHLWAICVSSFETSCSFHYPIYRLAVLGFGYLNFIVLYLFYISSSQREVWLAKTFFLICGISVCSADNFHCRVETIKFHKVYFLILGTMSCVIRVLLGRFLPILLTIPKTSEFPMFCSRSLFLFRVLSIYDHLCLHVIMVFLVCFLIFWRMPLEF